MRNVRVARLLPFDVFTPLAVLLFIPLLLSISTAAENYVEPGTLRLSHEIIFENVLQRVRPGWKMDEGAMTKNYSKDSNASNPWKAEWGGTLLTEAAARFTPSLFGRVLFEAQGDYADRLWRPNNINHHIDNVDRILFVREAEAKVEKEQWYARGFRGAPHDFWAGKGDFFTLYPQSFPGEDYMGGSGYFGIYPDRFRQDVALNISRRHVPEGFETGANLEWINADVAFGDELAWGYNESVFTRVGMPIGSTNLTFVYADAKTPYSLDPNEHTNAYSLAWEVPSEEGHRLTMGALYQPFRAGRPYEVADETTAGAGEGGSSYEISQKTAKKEDGLGARARYERHEIWFNREWIMIGDLTYQGILAGNKQQADIGVETDIIPELHANVQFTYRKPIEGPVPFLFEGTPDNMGAIVANPRGPDSPFTVNWNNREAVFMTTTLVFDPSQGSPLLQYQPTNLQLWNVNPDEDSKLAVAAQHRMSDYRTPTDRLYYFDENGDITWEGAGHSGAWASDGFLHEFRLLLVGRNKPWGWSLGFAGGQDLPQSSFAYSNDTTAAKPITDYYSIEARIEKYPAAVWGHYGTGVWGPEPYHRTYGSAFDRLWGLGVSYNITRNTTLDVSYLAARQDDDLFVSPDLGTYDEIRTLFSHRFGFLFLFQESAREGYRAQ